MKKTFILFLGLLAMTPGCQTKTELSDADKNAIVNAVKEISESFWGWNGKLNQADVQITNNGTLDEFSEAVRTLLDTIRSDP